MFEQNSFSTDNVSHTIVFVACAHLASNRAKEIGKRLLCERSYDFRADPILETAAIDILMKFGHVEKAESIFRSIVTKDTNLYAVLMNGYNSNNEPMKIH